MNKLLSFEDIIEMGEYAGETVKSCINKYGRKSILGILRYYDLDEEVMKECHYHKKGDEEKVEVKEVQDCTSVCAPVEEIWESRDLVEKVFAEYDQNPPVDDYDSTEDVEYYCWTDPYGYGEVEDPWVENYMRFPWERDDYELNINEVEDYDCARL